MASSRDSALDNIVKGFWSWGRAKIIKNWPHEKHCNLEVRVCPLSFQNEVV